MTNDSEDHLIGGSYEEKKKPKTLQLKIVRKKKKSTNGQTVEPLGEMDR